MIYKKNITGSSLLTSIIFAFVLMVVISALAYNYRISSLTIETLLDDEVNVNVDEGYLNNLFVSNDISSTIDQTIGDFRFLTTPDSVTVAFASKHNNIGLYAADPFLLSYNLSHDFYNNGVVEYTKVLIYNSLTNNTMTQYSEDLYPLNVPYVNANAMTGDLATYRLGNNTQILDEEKGFIGSITKSSSNLNIQANSAASSVAVPNDLAIDDYKFSVGWDLKDGLWSIFLTAYDTDKAYTSSTSLRNLIDDSAQAEIELADWNSIVSLSSGSGVPSGSIILAKWYHPAVDAPPKPLVLRKEESSDNPGTYILGFYNTSYDSASKVFTASRSDSVAASSDFDADKVFIAVPDNSLTLGVGAPLVFQQDNNGSDFTKVLQFNIHSAGAATALGNLTPVVEAEPVLVRRNVTQNYLIYQNASTYYSHYYSAGSLNTTAISPIQSATGTIQKIIAKFGLLFVVTDQYIYVDDFDISTSNLLNRISISGSDYQFLRDDDGLIYAMPNGLSCTIAGNCNANHRLYIRTEGSCASYGGCDFIDTINNINSYLGLVYKNVTH